MEGTFSRCSRQATAADFTGKCTSPLLQAVSLAQLYQQLYYKNCCRMNNLCCSFFWQPQGHFVHISTRLYSRKATIGVLCADCKTGTRLTGLELSFIPGLGNSCPSQMASLKNLQPRSWSGLAQLKEEAPPVGVSCSVAMSVHLFGVPFF